MSDPATHHRPVGTDITSCCGKELSELPEGDQWSHSEESSTCGKELSADDFTRIVFERSHETSSDLSVDEAFRRGAAFAVNLSEFGPGQYEVADPAESHPLWREGYRAGRLNLQRALSNPPAGWFTFGTHVDSDQDLEFWGEDEADGMPLWERPRRKDELSKRGTAIAVVAGVVSALILVGAVMWGFHRSHSWAEQGEECVEQARQEAEAAGAMSNTLSAELDSLALVSADDFMDDYDSGDDFCAEVSKVVAPALDEAQS